VAAKILHIDNLAFEHTEDILKVESVLLMNEILDNYIHKSERASASPDDN